MGYYRKVILGDNATASRYFKLAGKMLNEITRRSKLKMTYNDDIVFIIAKQYDGQKKAIFIVKDGALFLYTKTVTFDNIATFGGFVSKKLKSLFEIDFNDITTPSLVDGFEITDVVEGSFYIYPRTVALSIDPPLAEYLVNLKKLNPSEPRALNYSGAPFNFRELHRGTDRDFMYTTTDLPMIGYDAGAAIHERLWSDETNLITLKVTLPAALAGFSWPFVGADAHFSRYMQIVGNDIWLTEAKQYYSQIFFWKLAADLTWTNVTAWNGLGFGGASLYQYGSMLYNTVNSLMKFTSSVWYDVAGDPDDTEQLRTMNIAVTVELSFKPGDFMGYSGRTSSNETRINRCWCVAEDTYAFHIENTSQPAAIGDQIPDGVFLATAGTVELIYQAGPGRTMRSPKVDSAQPNLVLCGEEDRAGGNEVVFLLNVLTKKVTQVTDTTNHLPSSQFVR